MLLITYLFNSETKQSNLKVLFRNGWKEKTQAVTAQLLIAIRGLIESFEVVEELARLKFCIAR
jgi:hypothetical protein